MSAHPAAVYDLPTHFIDEGSHKFRTELPNIVDDLGLNIYAHRLYAHVKRRAGDSGKSTAGLRSMAKACGMSPGSAAKARQELLDLGLIRRRIEIVRHETGGGRYEVLTAADIWPANYTFYERLKRRQLKPLTAETRAAAARAHLVCFLIEKGHKVVRHRPEAKGASPELWGLKDARAHLASFLSDGDVSPHEHPPGGVSSPERGCSPHDTPGVSPREHKKEHTEERTTEEDPPTPLTPARIKKGGGAPKSRFKLSECVAWAEERKRSGGRINDAHALGYARWRDGTADEEIDKFLAPYDPPPEESRPTRHQFLPFEEALQAVSAVAQVAGYDVPGYISWLPVCEETREKLRRRFKTPEAEAAKPEACGAGRHRDTPVSHEQVKARFFIFSWESRH